MTPSTSPSVGSGEALEACPFCGGRAEPDTDDVGSHGIRCMDCTIYLGAYSTARRAAQVWNRRSPAQASAAAVGDAGARALIERLHGYVCTTHDSQGYASALRDIEETISALREENRAYSATVKKQTEEYAAAMDQLREENRGLREKVEQYGHEIEEDIAAFKERDRVLEEAAKIAGENRATISSLTANLDAAILGVRHAQAERDSLTARVAELERALRDAHKRFANLADADAEGEYALRTGCALGRDVARAALQASDKREKGEK